MTSTDASSNAPLAISIRLRGHQFDRPISRMYMRTGFRWLATDSLSNVRPSAAAASFSSGFVGIVSASEQGIGIGRRLEDGDPHVR